MFGRRHHDTAIEIGGIAARAAEAPDDIVPGARRRGGNYQQADSVRVQLAACVNREAHGEGKKKRNRKRELPGSKCLGLLVCSVRHNSCKLRSLLHLALCCSSNTVFLRSRVTRGRCVYHNSNTNANARGTRGVLRCFAVNFIQNRFFCNGTDNGRSTLPSTVYCTTYTSTTARTVRRLSQFSTE